MTSWEVFTAVVLACAVPFGWLVVPLWVAYCLWCRDTQ